MRHIPQNLVDLAEKNLAHVKNIGFNLYDDCPFGLDSPETFATLGLLSDEAIAQVFDRSIGVDRPQEEQDPRIPRHIGMALVRPDMYHTYPAAEKLIANNGFTLIESIATEIDSGAYWQMYSDALTGHEPRKTRLTRAAVYIGSPCRLLVFHDQVRESDGSAAADRIFSEFKGTQGTPSQGTLRGEVVLNSALKLGFDTLCDPLIAAAVDPFGAYRKIVAEKHQTNHATATYPMLFYNGVGIHVPNYSEMQTDLRAIMPELATEIEQDYEKI